jgi:N-methylhydantoinase A/oxoprolinase/acetone carboxylase beta subunit
VRIGIDVGGTNTDIVIVDGGRVLRAEKVPTTRDITGGIAAALAAVLAGNGTEPIRAVMIGTTHFTNAFVQGQGLTPTAIVRLCGPATRSIPPLAGWPDRLREVLNPRVYYCKGGFEVDGRVLAPLDPDELKQVASELAATDIRAVALSGMSSPMNPEHELAAAAILRAELPDLDISSSHEIGRLGLIERENATVINASLRDLAADVFAGFERALASSGLRAPVFITQNDGTTMSVEHARRFPVRTFSSGPTNSMRGAAVLSGLGTCAVVDVGGTTTDVGVLTGGFPREATVEVSVAGIRTNFRMPDVLSVGLGGGSLVRGSGTDTTVGPDSVGYRLTEQALVFGGDVLTATDVAVAAGRVEIGDSSLVADLDPADVAAALERIATDVADVVDRMRISADPLPVVAVGGGSVLLPDSFPGLGAVHRPEHFAVANAIGAAIAQVGGEVDRVFAIAPGQRDAAVDEARQEAVDRAVVAGADPATVEIVDFDEVPIPYLPGNATRIRCKAVGDLRIEQAAGRSA